MNTEEALKFIRRRLRRRHLQYWLLLGLAACMHVLGFALLVSFFSHAAGLALLVAAMLGCSLMAVRHGCLKRYSNLDAASYLDECTSSKDRFKSFIELKDSGQEPAKAELLSAQLENILDSSPREILPKLEVPRTFFVLLWALLLPWCGVLALFIYQKTLPQYNPEQVAILEQLLEKKDELPPELQEKLETLKDSLEEHPLLDAPVSDALAEAQEELAQSLEEEALETGEAKEKIIEESATTPPAQKENQEEPSPTPTPQAVPQQNSQANKPEEKQGEDRKKESEKEKQQEQGEGKQQEQKNQQGQGKESREQSQSEKQSQSAQGNGQGEGNAAGQGQAEQQSGQGSGEKESNAKQDSSGSQGKEQGKEQDKSESKDKNSKDQKGEGNAQSQQGKEGAKEGDAKKEQDKGSQGSEKGKGSEEGNGLDEAKKALDDLKEQIEKEKQQQDAQGKPKDSEAQKEGKDGQQKGKDQSEKNKDKKEGDSSKDTQGQQDKEKSKPEEGKDSEKESSGDTGGKSALPNPGEAGKTPDFSMALGTKEQERGRSKDVEVPPGDEQFDSRFAGKEGQVVQNKKGASPKTGLADVQLSKPESRKGAETQYIPPEYEGLLSGR